MYKTRQKFALAMSVLLFEMRIESDTPYGDNDNPVPASFALAIIDHPDHVVLIKKRIETSILEYVRDNPQQYKNGNGMYSYTTDCYDHAMAVDAYVDEQWRSTLTKSLITCDTCGSDAVQSKAWVRPNNNNEFVDLMSEEVQDNWCEDCDENCGTTSVETNIDAKVIGFQVVDSCDMAVKHPHMTSDKSVYDLEQARAMIDDDNNGDEQWQLFAVWTGTITGAVLMFSGDLRPE